MKIGKILKGEDVREAVLQKLALEWSGGGCRVTLLPAPTANVSPPEILRTICAFDPLIRQFFGRL